MIAKTNYWSFISYSHKDKNWGDWLHKGLETFALPSAVQNSNPNVGKNLYPIFRDREELPGSSDLGANISEALKNSQTLLVICSPRSAKSLWVNQEILNYQVLSPDQPIIALIVEGDIDNPQSENYCLPSAIQELLQNQNASLVDARESGRCYSLKLELVSKILPINLDELSASVQKRRRARRVLAGCVAGILAVGSWVAWDFIKQNQQSSLIAQSEKYSVVAQQALKSGDDTTALINARAALPKNLVHPEQPVNSRAAAVLNRLMSKPLLMIERGEIAHQIKGLRATNEATLWLLTDTLGGIHLFDLTDGNVRWTIAEPDHLISDINSQQQLIVRGKQALRNYDLLSGKLNCEIPLETRPHLGLDGSIDWMQKDWVVESQGHTTKGKPDDLIQESYRPSQIQFINSLNCQTSTLINIGFVAHFQLVDVLPDGSKITVTDTYLNGETISGFQRWPDVDEPVPESLFYLSGHSESFFAGHHNSQTYDGPLIKTSTKENISFIALQTNDKAGFVLTQFDWREKKIVNRQSLPSLPEKMVWQNSDENNILVFSSELPRSEGASDTSRAIKTPMMRVYSVKDLVQVEETTVSRNYSANALSPNLKYLVSLDSSINVKQLATQESFSRKRTQITQWNNLAWLDENRFLLAEQDGKVFVVGVNQEIVVSKIKAKECCYRSVGTPSGLVQSNDGALYQFIGAPTSHGPDHHYDQKLVYQPAFYKTDYRYFSKYDLLFIDETLRDNSQASVDEQHSHKLMRLSDGEILWEKTQPDSILPHEQYLSYLDDEQLVVVNFAKPQQPLTISLPKNLISFQYDPEENQLISLKHTPSYLNPSDSLLHVERYDVATNKKVADLGFDVGAVALIDKFFIFPESQHVVHIGTGLQGSDQQEAVTNSPKIRLKLLSLKEQTVQDLGALPDSISYSFSLKVEILDDYVKVEKAEILATSETLLIDRTSKKQHLFSNGDQIVIDQTLIDENQVIVTNYKDNNVEVLNLVGSNKRQLDCPFNGALNEILPLPTLGLLALRTDSLCIIDPKTWETLTVVDATNTSSQSGRFSGNQKINALLHNAGANTLTSLTGTNTAMTIPLNFDWRNNIDKFK